MKKAVKSALSIILCLAVIVVATTPTLAVGNKAVRIMIGDKKLDVSPILMQEGRAYAPYDELFNALGVSAVYDESAGTITAVNGDAEIIIELDDYYISIITGDMTQWVYTGAPTITDTSTGRIFVPIRFVAQVLGFVVGWNEETRSIALKTVDELIDESGATYTVMDKVLAYIGDFSEKGHRVDGSFQAEINLDSILDYYGDDGSEYGPLAISGTASGLIDPVGEDMNLNLKTNLSDFFSQLEALYEEELDEETLAIIAQLDNVDISLITNNNDGIIYIKSPLISTLAGISEDTWLSIETGETLSLSILELLTESMGMSRLSADDFSSAGADFKKYVELSLKDMLLEDTGIDTAEMLTQLNSLFSDQAMTRDGDDYVMTIMSSEADYGYEYSSMFELRFLFNGEEFAGVTANQKSAISYSYLEDDISDSSTELFFSFSSDGQSSLAISSTEGGVTLLSFDMAFTYTETDEIPAREPAEGSTVVSIDELTTLGSEEGL